jgi:hypothetical protein
MAKRKTLDEHLHPKRFVQLELPLLDRRADGRHADRQLEPKCVTYGQIFHELRDDVARRRGAHSPHSDKEETAS